MKHLFLGSKNFDEWRAVAQTTHRARFARVIEQAETYLAYVPPVEHPRETITYIGMAAANLAFAFRLTDDTRYLDRAREWIKIAISYPHWGKANLPDHDLDAGWLSFGLGLSYDWLYEFLPTKERDALCAKLRLQGTRLYDFAVGGEGNWWSVAFWQNHNWICYAGLATVAYALEREHPETRAWSQRAVENFKTVLALMPEDGSDYEGVVYWCYGFPWLLIPADLIQQQTGIDLHQSEFLRNTFYYRLYASAPNLIDTANFGDCHDRRSAHALAIYYRLASVYRNGHAQWLADHFERIGEWERERKQGLLKPSSASHAFLEFLWYDPTVAPTPIADLPTTRAFPDLGLVSARTDWSPDATFLVFKCGKPNGEKAWTLGHALEKQNDWKVVKTGHAHPDENSFILVRGDDYLAVDEGYSQKKQSCQHNTILVDGKGQYHEGVYNVADGLGVEWGGTFENDFAGRRVVYARGDAAHAYDPALTLDRFTRQMLFVDGKYIVICDDLASREPREFTWQLQTDAPMADGISQFAIHNFGAVLGDTRFTVSVVEPAQFAVKNIEQEIVAYPSSSTPEWVLRHPQHTLMLTPERTTATRFFVALTIATPTQVEAIACEVGSALSLNESVARVIVAFARGARGIKIAGEIETDARWIVAGFRGETLDYFAAGDATRVWIGKQLRFASAEPVSCEADGATWRVNARAPEWMSFWSASPRESVVVNGASANANFDAMLSLVRVFVPRGDVKIHCSERSPEHSVDINGAEGERI
ncbi:MAG: DUF4962 domain-containing protein [Chloroflexi bacterium]|nr:DUF4962 domain-containing protein [Chloroflexota bacterium]